MASPSYFRSLTGPPADKAAVLRPAHMPVWGLPKSSSPDLLAEDQLSPNIPLTASPPSARQSSRRSRPKNDDIQDETKSEIVNHRVEVINTLNRNKADDNIPNLLMPNTISPWKDNPKNALPTQTTERHTAQEQFYDSLLPRTSLKPIARSLQSSDAESSSEIVAAISPGKQLQDATKMRKPLAEPNIVAAANIPPAAQFSPSSSHRSSQRRDAATEAKNNTIHIGTIDIQLLPSPAPAQRTAPRQQRSLNLPVLSRGLTSSIGLRQG